MLELLEFLGGAVYPYLAYLAFCLYLLLIVAGASLAVFSASLVRALVGLVGALLGAAGMYMLMQSPFLGFMQILIYVGAVCVLIFFAIMLTDATGDGEEAAPVSLWRWGVSLFAGFLPLALLLPVALMRPAPFMEAPEPTPLAELGRALLEDYVLPFELISVILLVAMAGGVLLAFERRDK